MWKIAIGLAILVSFISVSLVDVKAQDCPSGHYYRMSGRCADPPARKPAVAAHPVKHTNKKTPPQGN
jgi:hypothetical protein